MATYSYLLPKDRPKAKVFTIEEPDKFEIHVTRILIDETVYNLRVKGKSFMTNISASEAYRARKRIMKQFDGEDVTIKAYIGHAEDPETKVWEPGYGFKLYRNS